MIRARMMASRFRPLSSSLFLPLLPATRMGVGHILELVRMILALADKQDVAACARVCSAWTEDALDIVWRELPSPLPLMRLVDESGLYPTMSWQTGQGQAIISSKPIPWARIRKFTMRVKRMGFDCTPWKTQIASFALFKALSPDAPLLPNLEEVVVFPSSEMRWVQLVAMFLHPGVRRLEIRHPEGDGPSYFTYPDFFREFSERCPHLEYLTIHGCSTLTLYRVWRPEDPINLARYAGMFPGLVHLSAPEAVVRHLENIPTTFPNLKRLIEVTSLYPKPYVQLPRHHWEPHIANTRIETLALSLTLACASTIITTNHPSHLRTLLLEAHMPRIDQQPLRQFLQALGGSCPALEDLTVRWTGILSHLMHDPQLANTEIDATVFDPLAHCTLLSSLDITIPSSLTFNENGAAGLATILPNLQICRLTFIPIGGPAVEQRTLPELGTLVPFAQHCRRLQELSLVLDPRISIDDVDMTTIVAFNPEFRKLSIGQFAPSVNWDPESVAQYLSNLVPKYCSVKIPPRPHWSARWQHEDTIAAGTERLKQAFVLLSGFL
ncbi:hypothetical protein R3P38DRAFT_607377 [Favolaschia claudopus]|uniref:F-box domain-containing protein n=1 Tax=Favolaschia claudopus TaxID=2862362 RepID=A0AAW0CA89_9AGAR